jgi:hypothetical protein
MDAVLDWLGENSEFVITSALALASTIVALAIPVWQRKPKQLDYAILGGPKPTSKKYLDGFGSLRRLSDPHIATVRILNTGKRAVEGSHYVKPIRINCEANLPVHASIAAESFPEIVDPVPPEWTNLSGQTPSLKPPLMNVDDWFDVLLLSDGPPGRIRVTSRFVDQSRGMRRVAGATRRDFQVLRLLMFGMAAFFVFVSIVEAPNYLNGWQHAVWTLLVCSVVASIVQTRSVGSLFYRATRIHAIDQW